MNTSNFNHELPNCGYSAMFHLDYAHYIRDCVIVGIEKNLFNTIKNSQSSGLSANEIIQKCNFSERGGKAAISLLTATGYLRQLDKKYYLTNISDTYLVSTSPFFYGPMLKLHYTFRKEVGLAFELEQYVRDILNPWETGTLDQNLSDIVAAAMESASLPPAIGLAKSLDLNSSFETKSLLDVGGGSGCFSIAVVKHQAPIRAIVLDLPTACITCDKYIKKEEGKIPANSVVTYPCNMFVDPFPKYDDKRYGFDTVLLSNILHDWGEDKRVELLKKIYNALPTNGTVLIHEALLNDTEDGPLESVFMSFHMFVVTKGKQFTFAELKDLLSKCGFKDVQFQVETGDVHSVVSARKL